MDQVEKAFNGRYREVNRETQQWYTYNHPVPEPRPGVVSEYLLPSIGQMAASTQQDFMSAFKASPIPLRLTSQS